jgi:hypothetical protein
MDADLLAEFGDDPEFLALQRKIKEREEAERKEREEAEVIIFFGTANQISAIDKSSPKFVI